MSPRGLHGGVEPVLRTGKRSSSGRRSHPVTGPLPQTFARQNMQHRCHPDFRGEDQLGGAPDRPA